MSLKYVLLSLFTGLCVIAVIYICIIERDVRVVQSLGRMVHEGFQNALATPLEATPSAVRILRGRVTLTHVGAAASDGSWRWSAERLHLDIRPWASIRSRRLRGTITLEGVVLVSKIRDNGSLAMYDHFAPILSSTTNAPLMDIDVITVTNSLMMIQHGQGSLSAAVRACIPMNKAEGAIRMWWRGATLQYTDLLRAEEGSGSLTVDLHKQHVYGNMVWDIPKISAQDRRLTLSGTWSKGARAMVHGSSQGGGFRLLCMGDPEQDLLTTEGECALDCVRSWLPSPVNAIQGERCTWSSRGSWRKYGLDSSVSLAWNGGWYGTYALPALRAAVHMNGDTPWGECQAQWPDGRCIACTGKSVGTGLYEGDFQVQALQLPLLGGVGSVGCKGEWSYDRAKQSGEVSGEGTLEHQGHMTSLSGAGEVTGERITLHGEGAAHRMDAIVHEPFSDHWTSTISVRDGQGIAGAAQVASGLFFTGSVAYRLLAALMRYCDIGVPHVVANTQVQFEGQSDLFGCQVHVGVDDLHVRIPNTYNLIRSAQGSFQYDSISRTLHARRLCIQLHKGSVTSDGGVLCLDGVGKPLFIYAPVRVHDCFVSRAQDIFAVASGAGYVYYTPDREQPWAVRGLVLLDRSHMRGNIFDLQRSFLGNGEGGMQMMDMIEGELSIMTRSPLRVKTSFLEAAAMMHLQCHLNDTRATGTGGTGARATGSRTGVEGTIDITQGALLFPYKPLFIQRCRVTLRPDVPDDPLVEMHAENTIKGYTVRLDIQGSVKDPKLMFRASPDLAEEKIIGLLWGGSEQGSLYLAMSTAMMQAIEQLLFGPAEGSSRVQQWLSTLFKPLGSVRLVPGFTDQTGRGGLRGTLAVEVNDRLRGVIKQNFELPQDTMLEVEYALSDDARIRGFKDERGDVGAELEGRWKF